MHEMLFFSHAYLKTDFGWTRPTFDTTVKSSYTLIGWVDSDVTDLCYKIITRWMFTVVSEVGRVHLLRWDAIQSRFVNFRCHDQSRSDLPFRYDHIRPDRIVAIESTIGSGSETIMRIGFPDLGRSDTCRYVPIRSSRTDAFCYDCIRVWSRCFSRSWSRVITIWATTPKGIYAAGLTMGFIVSWTYTA